MRPLRIPSTPLTTALVVLNFACAKLVAAPVDFSREVLPVLSENCFHCHGPDVKARKAELRLDTQSGAFQKNKDGAAAVVAGKPEASGLVERIFSHESDELMPPPKSNRKLTATERDLLKRWVTEGAQWGTHWAFSPLKKPQLPQSGNRNPIDALVRERLKRESLELQPRAPRRTLLRRLSLDLTGLPPSLEEAANFDADTADDAIERVVDRLLASPRFGERMAWDWIEAARYADSNGYQGDNERSMWPWRDWVVDAFNRNLPYDQFTLWQLAGDLLPNPTQEQLLATGFLRNHPINGEGGRIAEENRVDYVMDMAETTGTVWLGLTFQCCRCHDHKYDPLLQSDYYRFFGFFNQTPVTGAGGDPQMAPRIDVPQGEETMRLESARGALKELDSQIKMAWNEALAKRTEWITAGGAEEPPNPRDAKKFGKPGEIKAAAQLPEAKWSGEQRKFMEAAWGEQEAGFKKLLTERDSRREKEQQANKAVTRVMVMGDMPKPRQTFVLNRGLYTQPGVEVTSGVPVNLPPLAPDQPPNRLGLAGWLAAAENPLMARVTVNRLWQQVFGIGLVKTTEDFGVQAETPAQLDLLDWLAAEFRESGWNVKALLQLILTSETYLQSSNVPDVLARNDPQNRLLARGARFRLPAWAIRDQALAVSGLLVGKIGGSPVKPYQPAGIWEEATFGGGKKTYLQDTGENLYRRSLYTFWRRIIGPTMFFDTPSRMVCSVKPLRTNTPLHALNTLNDPTYVEAARVLAQRVWTSPDTTFDSRLSSIFQRVLAREPSPAETALWAGALNRKRATYAADIAGAERLLAVGATPRDPRIPATEHAAYTALCLSILNLDETLTKE